jgi:hypothetical protein
MRATRALPYVVYIHRSVVRRDSDAIAVCGDGDPVAARPHRNLDWRQCDVQAVDLHLWRELRQDRHSLAVRTKRKITDEAEGRNGFAPGAIHPPADDEGLRQSG